jgi:hypothetical protein
LADFTGLVRYLEPAEAAEYVHPPRSGHESRSWYSSRTPVFSPTAAVHVSVDWDFT